MRTIIAGSRNVKKYETVVTAIRQAVVKGFRPTCIISGGAIGVDTLGEKFAREFGFALEVYPADWNKYGNRAGVIRNEEMAKDADALIAIWDGKSKGTKHMIDVANRLGLPTYVYEVQNG